MSAKRLIAVTATSALFISLIAASPASAHVSVIPGVNANGSTLDALRAGKSGYLYFRIGHGCTLEKPTINPVTKASIVGTKYGTSAFSIEIPVVAQGTGSTIPKPAWVPGFKTSVAKDLSTNRYTITWTAISSDFVIPDGPDGTTGANSFFDFGVRIQWASDAAGQTVFFKAVQTCKVEVPGIKGRSATKSKPAIRTVKPQNFNIYNSWDVVDGSGMDSVPDDTEHNTAPSVTVLPAA